MKRSAYATRFWRACGRAGAAVAGVCVLAAALGLSSREPARAQRSETWRGPEVRALWVQRASLTSPGTVDAMVHEARAAGFNTLIVQVRGRGDAYFAGGVEPRAAALGGQPLSFDPLARVLALAHPAGLRVHIWVNVNLVATATDLPSDPAHVVYRHPEWLMVPRALAGELGRVDPRSRGYVRALAEDAVAHADRVEGLYLSPVHEGSAAHAVAVVSDLVDRYDVDGVHFDYIRYPNTDFDYSRGTLEAFRRQVVGDLSGAERARYDGRLADEPTIYADAFPERWHEFRRTRLTSLVARLREAITSRRPTATVSAAVFPDAEDARLHRMQDWSQWIRIGLLDVLCPMAYTTDAALFRGQIASVVAHAGGRPVWAGIGAYRLSSSETIENILAARDTGARGVILFSYDNLSAVPGRPRALADIGRAAFD